MFAGSKINTIAAAKTANVAEQRINASAQCPGYESGSRGGGFLIEKWIVRYNRAVKPRQSRHHGIARKASQFPSIEPERTIADVSRRDEVITLSVNTELHRAAALIEKPRQSEKTISCSMVTLSSRQYRSKRLALL